MSVETQKSNVDRCIERLNLKPIDEHHAEISGANDETHISPNNVVMVFESSTDPLHLLDDYGYTEATLVPVVEDTYVTGRRKGLYQFECSGHVHYVQQNYVEQLCDCFGTEVSETTVLANPNDDMWPIRLQLDEEYNALVAPLRVNEQTDVKDP